MVSGCFEPQAALEKRRLRACLSLRTSRGRAPRALGQDAFTSAAPAWPSSRGAAGWRQKRQIFGGPPCGKTLAVKWPAQGPHAGVTPLFTATSSRDLPCARPASKLSCRQRNVCTELSLKIGNMTVQSRGTTLGADTLECSPGAQRAVSLRQLPRPQPRTRRPEEPSACRFPRGVPAVRTLCREALGTVPSLLQTVSDYRQSSSI